MSSGMINHGDLFPDDDNEGKKLHNIDEFKSKMEELFQGMNKKPEEIVEESEYIGQIKNTVDDLKDDPVDDSSVYVLALDDEHKLKPTFFYSSDRDEEEIEYLITSLLKQLPTPTAADILHKFFHEVNIQDEDLHESIVWKSNKIANDLNKINPAVLQALSDQNREN